MIKYRKNYKKMVKKPKSNKMILISKTYQILKNKEICYLSKKHI